MHVRLHCRQYPQLHSGPGHFCISHLKDDKEFIFFKSLGKLFHNLLPWSDGTKCQCYSQLNCD